MASIIRDDDLDGLFENLVHSFHFLAATLHVYSSHLLRNCLTLLLGNWRETLSFEEINTSSFRAKIRLQAD